MKTKGSKKKELFSLNLPKSVNKHFKWHFCIYNRHNKKSRFWKKGSKNGFTILI